MKAIFVLLLVACLASELCNALKRKPTPRRRVAPRGPHRMIDTKKTGPAPHPKKTRPTHPEKTKPEKTKPEKTKPEKTKPRKD